MSQEYDRQFELELEKAKALSLEMFELDQIRQKRLSQSSQGSSTSTSIAAGSEIPTNVREYKSYLERKLGRPLSGGKPDGWKPVVEPARRSSEITPPTFGATTSKVENDLMDFNAPSPEKPKDPQTEAHASFIQLVDQMHK